MDKITEALALYLSTLRAITVVFQNCHWKSKNEDAYSHHLLFERLYNDAQETLDGAAEKFIGVFDEECLKLSTHNLYLYKVLQKYETYDEDFNFIEMSLRIEKDFLKLSQDLYDLLDSSDELTLGLDDFIMATANKHEEFVYLLKQQNRSINISD